MSFLGLAALAQFCGAVGQGLPINPRRRLAQPRRERLRRLPLRFRRGGLLNFVPALMGVPRLPHLRGKLAPVGFLVPTVPAPGKRQFGLPRPQTVHDALRRTVQPVADLSGQLLHRLPDLGCTVLHLVPDAHGGNLDAALLELPRTKGKLRQGRAVQRHGPHGLVQLRALVAALPRRRCQLKRLVALRH